MESGRSTPVAMSRPSSRHANAAEAAVTDPASSPRPPERPANAQNRLPSPPPMNRIQQQTRASFDSTMIPASNASKSDQTCLLQHILDSRTSSIAIIQGSVLTAIGLGWAVYSRIFRFNMEAWISKFGLPEQSQNKDTLSDFTVEESEHLAQVDRQPRLDTAIPSIQLEKYIDSAPAQLGRDEVYNVGTSDHKYEHTGKRETKSRTQALLQKHINYLEPWVSKQPFSPTEQRQDHNSEGRIEDELRRMSLPAFTDLSTAIYRDVRRREQESSPESPNPPVTPGWDGAFRNKENEARMVLCRTINEQYLRLVLALVLELARRIAEIRIGVRRRELGVGI